VGRSGLRTRSYSTAVQQPLPLTATSATISMQARAHCSNMTSSVPVATDQMLPEVSACPLRARSGCKPGELMVTPGEADTAPKLGRTSSPGAGRRLPKQPLMRQTREQPSNQMSSNRHRSQVRHTIALAVRTVTWLRTKRPPVQSGHPVKGADPPTCSLIGSLTSWWCLILGAGWEPP
jgi:hypothetical protein